MSDVAQLAPAVRRPGVLAWFVNPYVQIIIGALLDTCGEILLKKGAIASPTAHGWLSVIGLTPLASAWTWIGIISYVLSLVSWLHVLRSVPLSVAFPLINVVHVFVPVGASIFLHEHVSGKRWLGICLIVLGVFAIVKPLVKAEEKL